jgi:hypothetical protein
MKYFIQSLLLLISIAGYAQDKRDSYSQELQNEVVGDPYLAPDKHSKRTSRIAYKLEAASSTISSIITTQVNIDSSGNNITLDAANEPNLAISPVDPNKIVIGWRQFDNVSSNFRQAGFSYSSDGGVTWAKEDVIQPGIFHSDPVLDCDSAGNFYYNSLHPDSLNSFSCTVFKSTDGGASWDTGTYANGGDKQWMYIDKSGAGINNIYSFWTLSATSCVGYNSSRSKNGGMSYEPCEYVHANPFSGTMDMDEMGALYIGASELFMNPDSIVVAKCDSPEATAPLNWSYKNVYMGGSFVNSNPSSINPAGLIGQINIAVDHSSTGSGNIYLAASLERPGPDKADVMFCKSIDGGQTWSQAQRINDDTSDLGQQWFATLSVAPNGRIDLVWLDTRDIPTTDYSALYYSYSFDQGNTWSANEKLSASFNPHFSYPAQNKMGDYFDMISDDVSAHLAWANTLNGEEDVYYSIITPPAPSAIAESLSPPLTVYPNPTSGNVKVSSLALIKAIEVYSVEGSRILTKQISSHSTDLDLSNLTNGIYFLNMNFENGMYGVRKLVVNSFYMK